jgi:ankyrin repeat protein
LRKLLQSGADLNAVSTKEGFSVLHYAALYSSDKVLKWIKSKDRVKVNLDLTTTDGDTALHIAIMKGDIDTVKLVIDLGVDLNKPTQYGVSPIFLAVEFGYFAILKYLCQKNVSVHGVVTLTRKELLKTMDGHITIPLRSSWSNLNSYLEQAGVTQDDARCTLTLLEIARIMKHDDIANFIGKIAGSRASSHSSGQTSVSKDAEKRVGLGQSMK